MEPGRLGLPVNLIIIIILCSLLTNIYTFVLGGFDGSSTFSFFSISVATLAVGLTGSDLWIIPLKAMASNKVRAKKAIHAMTTLGFNKKKTENVLRRLFYELFDENWGPIEDDNYQALIDAILEDESDGPMPAATPHVGMLLPICILPLPNYCFILRLSNCLIAAGGRGGSNCSLASGDDR